MGKLKELQQEIKDIRRDQQKRQLKAKYPSIAEFIEEAFMSNEESKVYELILSFKQGVDACDKVFH